MITTMFFILVPFLKRAPCIIIHLARNAEKGGGVLMSIILPNLNHSFVPDSGSGSGFRIPVPFQDSGFRISWFSIRPNYGVIAVSAMQQGVKFEVLKRCYIQIYPAKFLLCYEKIIALQHM